MADELLTTNNTQTTTPTTTGTTTTTASYSATTADKNLGGMSNTAARDQAQATYPNGINSEYLNNYMSALGGGVDHSNDINNMYQGLLDKNLAQLEAANKINQSNYDANREQLIEDYNKQRAAASVDYERNRYNQNLQAQMNGLNVGTGSQMALALNNTYQQGQNALRSAQMKAQADIDRAVTNLNVQYQADIAAAIGENDYQKAAELYKDKLNREQQMTTYYKMMTEEMNTRASYGDFSMMKQLYGTDAADTAKWVWATQNPRAAYDQGQITPQQYYNIVGEWPRGYTPPSSGGGSGGYNSFKDSFYGRAQTYGSGGNMTAKLADYRDKLYGK